MVSIICKHNIYCAAVRTEFNSIAPQIYPQMMQHFLIGGAVPGVFGMIATIPIAAVLKDILERIVTHFENKKFGKSKTTDNI